MEHHLGYYFALILTVVGTLLYHVAQKTMPPTVRPFGLLAAAFATALILCLLFVALDGTRTTAFQVREHVSLRMVAGAVLCISGLILLVRSKHAVCS